MSRAKISQAPPRISGEALEEATRSTTLLAAPVSGECPVCNVRSSFMSNLSGNNVKEVNISQLARLTHKKQKEAKLCMHEPNPSLFLFLNIQTEHIS